MTPVYLHAHDQKTTPLPLIDPVEKEIVLLPATNVHKQNNLVFPVAKANKVVDPSQWDEAWFANYE